jgi:hypothetical protein
VELDAPANFKGNMVVDEKKNKIPLQRLSGGKIAFMATGVPANGSMTYTFGNNKKIKSESFNAPIRYGIDSVMGGIKTVQAEGKEWVNNNQYKNILQAIYVKGLDPSSFVLTGFKKMEWTENGPVRKTLKVTAGMDGANEIVYEINQYAGWNVLHMAVVVDKKAIRDKESLHIAFPFALKDPEVKVGVGESYITPIKSTIPGSNKDFYSVQRWIDVSDENSGVTIASPQGALWEVGKLINEEKTLNGFKKWETSGSSSPNIFLYAMNNYWHTNYKADQEGKVRFDFYLSFHGAFDLKRAGEFGYDVTEPLKAIY